MKKLFKCVSITFFGFSILYFIHYFKLDKIVNGLITGSYFKDGDGIGVYFIGFEINDRAQWDELYIYRDMFLSRAIIIMILALVSFIIYKRLTTTVVLKN
ncbi:MAG: hypothetical protein H7Y18_01480 [Clostridiaceae bacterium]|nr:hypothetical protein [Clostridiaceae bacterium]